MNCLRFFFWIDNQSNNIDEKRKEKYKLYMMMNTGKHKQTTKKKKS